MICLGTKGRRVEGMIKDDPSDEEECRRRYIRSRAKKSHWLDRRQALRSAKSASRGIPMAVPHLIG